MPTTNIQQILRAGMQLHQAGRMQQAEGLYRQALLSEPNNADALHLLGLLCLHTGRAEAAVDLIRRAIEINPAPAEFHCNLGNALAAGKKLDQAVASFRSAIAAKPDYADAWYNLGNALGDQKKWHDAIAAYRRALTTTPDDAEARYNLGNACRALGCLDDAIASYQTAIALRPKYLEAHSNLGAAFQAQGHADQAIACFQQALAINPTAAEVHNNLGTALRAKGQLDEAVTSFRKAIALQPAHQEAHINLGNVLKDQGLLDEALAAYQDALAINPENAAAHSNKIYLLHFHPRYDGRALLQEQQRWNQQHAVLLKRFIQPHTNVRSPDRRLKVGYVSPDLRDHVVGRNVLPLFCNHDRRQFEIFCYSNSAAGDAITDQIRGNADHWRNIAAMDDAAVADMIRNDGIDILVDLALHMAANRLLVFARKPAPVQVTFAGYPAGTGLDTMDYRLTDPYLDPIGISDALYAEQSIRLADSFWCYDAQGAQPAVNALPALSSGIVTFGCLNNFCKINAGVLQLWAQLLRAVDNSRLILLTEPGSHRQRTLAFLEQQAIASHRIEFISPHPREQYLQLYHRIDLGLDSFPYNGHTTSLDSYWMGVPVVTLVGQTAVGRAGLSQLCNLGVPELAVESPDQFVTMASALARDLQRLADLRRTLRQRMQQSPLMDSQRFARNIECAYRLMWQNWCCR